MKKMFFTAIVLLTWSTIDAKTADPVGVHSSTPTPCEGAWNSAYGTGINKGLSDELAGTIADSAYEGCIAAGGN